MYMRLARLEALVTAQNMLIMDRLDAQNDLLGHKLDAQNNLMGQRLDAQGTLICTKFRVINTTIEDHEKRIRAGEKKGRMRDWIEGLTAFAAAASFFWPNNYW